jgi:hypothetical protein
VKPSNLTHWELRGYQVRIIEQDDQKWTVRVYQPGTDDTGRAWTSGRNMPTLAECEQAARAWIFRDTTDTVPAHIARPVELILPSDDDTACAIWTYTYTGDQEPHDALNDACAELLRQIRAHNAQDGTPEWREPPTIGNAMDLFAQDDSDDDGPPRDLLAAIHARYGLTEDRRPDPRYIVIRPWDEAVTPTDDPEKV